MYVLCRLQCKPTVALQYFIMLFAKVLTLLSFNVILNNPLIYLFIVSSYNRCHYPSHSLNKRGHSATTTSPIGWPITSMTLRPMNPLSHPRLSTHTYIRPPTLMNITIRYSSSTASLTHSYQFSQKCTITH
jgi:hypothetical protein